MALSTQAMPLAAPARRVPWAAPVVAVVLAAAQLGLLGWLLRLPVKAPTPDVSFEHLVVVANVALLALLVAVFVARAALQQKAYRVLLLALGFLSMSGFFAVHALATPGVILPASGQTFSGGTYHDEHGAASVLGISAYLSLVVPALFFSSRYLPLDWRPSKVLLAQSRVVVALIAAVLIAYGALGDRRVTPAAFAGRDSVVAVLKLIIPMVAATTALVWLGFYIVSALYMGLFARWLGRYRWPWVAVLTIAMPAAIYATFELGFKVTLPKSFLYNAGILPF